MSIYRLTGSRELNVKALVGAFNQEKALVGAFSVIVQPVVEPMEHYTALLTTNHINFLQRSAPRAAPAWEMQEW